MELRAGPLRYGIRMLSVRLVLLVCSVLGLRTAIVPAEVMPGLGREPRALPKQEIGSPTANTFLTLFEGSAAERKRSFQAVRGHWNLNFAPMVLEVLYLVDFEDPGDRRRLWRLLEKKTGERLDRNPFVWLQWLWRQDFEPHPDYPEFKGRLYAAIDQRFERWFYPGMRHKIRLDEVLWGGVRVDGIPPLENPDSVPAGEADYLAESDIVFGVYLNGEARAYPKRILAWHELFNDSVGGVEVTCAYCTLCGSAVLYRQDSGDQRFDFGTSGFLYRSNKLMYDRQTYSLWSALEGVPVLGVLAGQDLALERLPLVTTTWGAWRKRHPGTRVLFLETGFRRDYREGMAYREYFASDELMFPVPQQDSRLRNKQEVLAVRIAGKPVAYEVQMLKRVGLLQDKIGERLIVILTDESGASRVYDRREENFAGWDREHRATDDAGGVWRVEEEALLGPAGQRLSRLPAHHAFWFGWFAQFPQTRLVAKAP